MIATDTDRGVANIYSRLIVRMLLAAGLCFAALVVGQGLAASLGVPEWDGSWFATLLYSLLIGYAIGAASDGVRSSSRALLWISGGILLGVMAELARSGGLLPGVWLGPLVTATAWAVAVVCPSLNSAGGRLIAALILALWLSTVVAGLWTLLTAPTYAEGFVMLGWLILGVGHLAGALSLALIPPRRASATPSISLLRPISAMLLGLLLSLGIGIFMMLQEGEMPMPLGQVPDAGAVFDSIEQSRPPDLTTTPAVTKADVITLLERQPNKDISQIATLYLLSGDPAWAERFREETLKNARAGRFTGSGGSVKYGQRYTMLFAIYYREISRRFPDLFADTEQVIVTDWFANIVESILTPGWVDWL